MSNIFDEILGKIDKDIKYNTLYTINFLDNLGGKKLLDDIINPVDTIIPGTKKFKKDIRKSLGVMDLYDD